MLTCEAGTVARQVARLPDISAPAGGASTWVVRAMRLNGVPMTIKQFTSPTTAVEVLHRYERELRTSSTKTHRSHAAAWHTLAVMADDYFATIRVRDTARGAEGTITVTPPLAQATPKKHTDFPHPQTARLVSLQEYDDDGVEAEHISFASRRSVAIAAREFATRLTSEGWRLLRSEATARRGDGHVIEAQKAAALALINVRRENGTTTILVVWRKT